MGKEDFTGTDGKRRMVSFLFINSKYTKKCCFILFLGLCLNYYIFMSVLESIAVFKTAVELLI